MGGLVLPGSGGGYVNPIATPVVDYDFKQNLLYGPLLSVSRASAAYVDDTQGNWTLVPPNTLRRSDKGALIEGQQTNNIRNNSMQGAVAGSPGTLPTFWGRSPTLNGLAFAIAGIGTQNGVEYIDVSLSGTPTASGTFFLSPETTPTSGAALNQPWTFSSFLAVVGGSLTNTQVSLRMAEGGGASAANNTLGAEGLSAALKRYVISRTITQADTSTIQGQYAIDYTLNQPISITLRIGWPQLEQWNPSVAPQGGASSPIRTTGAAATRAADLVTALLPVSPSAITIAVVAQTPAFNLGYSHALACISNGTANERVNLYRNNANGPKITVNSSAGNSGPIGSSSVAAGTRFAAAAAFASGDRAFSVNSGAVDTDATPSGYPTSVTQINVGTFPGGAANPWNGYIERLAILPARMVNAELQRLSTLSTWGG